MSDLCRSLEAEHRVIERVLDALERAADRAATTGVIDGDFFRDAIKFVREFADGLHHQKEESALFPRMEAAGVPREGGPIGVMLYEHELGRRHIRAMDEVLEAALQRDPVAHSTLMEEARAYVDLLRAHIRKEDRILFPMADRVLGESQKEIVRADFASAEKERATVTSARRDWAERLQ